MTKIYVPVSVNDELPEPSKDVFAFHDKDDWQSECYISPNDGKWYNTWDGLGFECGPTHWLKEITLPTEEWLQNATKEFYASDESMGNSKDGSNFMAGVNYILNLLTPNNNEQEK